MGSNKNPNGHASKEWEDALANSRPGIEFTLMNFERGIVRTTIGTIKARKGTLSAFWTMNGHCYVHGRRVKDFDINFTQP